MNCNGENKRVETFTVCRYNPGILVGDYGTIKNNDTGEVLEQTLSGTGYWKVENPMITPKNSREYEFVHRLIALTYVRGYSYRRYICHHKDNNPLNNNPENLIWIEKKLHKRFHEKIPPQFVA